MQGRDRVLLEPVLRFVLQTYHHSVGEQSELNTTRGHFGTRQSQHMERWHVLFMEHANTWTGSRLCFMNSGMSSFFRWEEKGSYVVHAPKDRSLGWASCFAELKGASPYFLWSLLDGLRRQQVIKMAISLPTERREYELTHSLESSLSGRSLVAQFHISIKRKLSCKKIPALNTNQVNKGSRPPLCT